MNDAWIFLSIGDAGGQTDWVPLDRLVAATDANNHAIPSPDELGQAVSNLVAAGLVEVRNTETRLTGAGVKAYLEASRPNLGHIQRMFALAEAWTARGYPVEVARTWSIDSETLGQAYRTYARRY